MLIRLKPRFCCLFICLYDCEIVKMHLADFDDPRHCREQNQVIWLVVNKNRIWHKNHISEI